MVERLPHKVCHGSLVVLMHSSTSMRSDRPGECQPSVGESSIYMNPSLESVCSTISHPIGSPHDAYTPLLISRTIISFSFFHIELFAEVRRLLGSSGYQTHLVRATGLGVDLDQSGHY